MLKQYVVQWRYRSGMGGPWQEGEVVEVEEGLAKAINVDSPGVLKPFTTENTKNTEKKKEGGGKKGKDRMVKKGESTMEFVMGKDQEGYGKEIVRE